MPWQLVTTCHSRGRRSLLLCLKPWTPPTTNCRKRAKRAWGRSAQPVSRFYSSYAFLTLLRVTLLPVLFKLSKLANIVALVYLENNVSFKINHVIDVDTCPLILNPYLCILVRLNLKVKMFHEQKLHHLFVVVLATTLPVYLPPFFF